MDDEADAAQHTVTLTYDGSVASIEAAIRDAGLDPTDWDVAKVAVACGVKGKTLRLSLERRSRVVPARTDGPRWMPPTLREWVVPSLWVVLSDAQCPHHDPVMHQLVCRFLDRFEPDGLIANGDVLDFPTLSSYTPNPMMDRSVNECLTSGYEVLRDWRAAAGSECKCYFIPGNHEERLRKYLLRGAPNLYETTRPGEEQRVLSLPYLLRLDELGYEFVTGETGDWPQASFDIVPGELTVIHGWLTSKSAGRSAAEHLGRSVIQGHTHRASHVVFTRNGRQVHAVENGTLAKLKGGLGYAVEPDWVNAFSVVTVDSDGRFTIQLVVRCGDELVFGTEVIK